MEAYDLLIQGQVLEAIKSAIEMSYGYYIWLLIILAIIIVIYIKSDSLLVSSVFSFVLLLAFSQFISMSLMPLIAVFMVFELALVIYKFFIKSRK